MHVIALLRAVFPEASLLVAARCGLVRWCQHRGLVDRAYDLEALRLHGLYAGRVEYPDDHPVRTHDLIVSFLDTDGGVLAAALRQSVRGRVISIDPRLSGDTLTSGRHITEQWREALNAAIGSMPVIDGSRYLLQNPEQKINDRAPEIICHPGSGGVAKCAPLDLFETIVRRLRSAGRRVSWMVGPVERERWGDSVMDRLRESAPVIEEQDLPIACEAVCGAQAFVGNDAGMSHVAAGAGLATAVLFGPTDPDVWRPLGPRVCVHRFGDQVVGSDWVGEVTDFLLG